MDKEKKSAKTYSNPTNLEKLIKEHKPTEPKKEVMLKDISQKNLYMKLTATNNAFIYVYYPTPTSKKSITIGKYPTISLASSTPKSQRAKNSARTRLKPTARKEKSRTNFWRSSGALAKRARKAGACYIYKKY